MGYLKNLLAVSVILSGAMMFSGCSTYELSSFDNGTTGEGNGIVAKNDGFVVNMKISRAEGDIIVIKNGTLEKNFKEFNGWSINMEWKDEYAGLADELVIETVGGFPKEIIDNYTDNEEMTPVNLLIQSEQQYGEYGATPIADPYGRGMRAVNINDNDIDIIKAKFEDAFLEVAIEAGLAESPVIIQIYADRVEPQFVTEDNVKEFFAEFLAAINSDFKDMKSIRALPDEYNNNNYGIKESFVQYGDFTGRDEVKQEEYYNETNGNETGLYKESHNLRSYSNSGRLFLDGTVNTELIDEKIDNGSGIEYVFTSKIIGEIEFDGMFVGKVVLDDIERVTIEDEDYEEISDEFTKGKLFVESYGARIPLPIETVEEIEPYSPNIEDNEIDFIPELPEIPAFGEGELTERGGIPIDESNIEVLFDMITNMRTGVRARSYSSEETMDIEQLTHGEVSGYTKLTANAKYFDGSSDMLQYRTMTTEFFDMSDDGIVYTGGGMSVSSMSIYGDIEGFGEQSMSGMVNFNGTVKGTIVLDEFNTKVVYTEEDEKEYSFIGGTVKIGSVDVTERFFRYVVDNGLEF